MENKQQYIPFTEEMKKEYTILAPNMLPMHFELLIRVMKRYGYNIELLRNGGHELAELGVRYVHNDTCYPAILVIGQFLQALQSGKYDTDKVALIYFQTGGGCRASNYVSLLRKALARAGFGVKTKSCDLLAGVMNSTLIAICTLAVRVRNHIAKTNRTSTHSHSPKQVYPIIHHPAPPFQL